MIKSGAADPYRFVIGGLTLWTFFSIGLSFVAVSPVLPLITEEYGISYTMAGLMVGAIFIILAACGLPAAVMVGRLGLKRMYTVGLLLMGMMSLAALSPGFEGLLALRILFGLGLAIIMPATGPIVMQWFRPGERLLLNSLDIAFVNLGIVVSFATAAPLADIIGWQRVLGLFGAISVSGAFAWQLWGRTREDAENVTAPVTLSEAWATLRNRTILLLGIADAACFAQYFTLTGWLPTFYHETRGMSLTAAGFIIGLLPFVGIFGVLLGGVLPLKIESKRVFFIVPGVMIGLGGLGSYLIDNTAVIYVAVIILGLGSFLYIPTMRTLPMELGGMTPNAVAIAWGWLVTTSGITNSVSPLVVGAIRDRLGGFIPGFLIFSGVAWLLFISGLLLPKTGPRRAQSPDPATPTTTVQE